MASNELSKSSNFLLLQFIQVSIGLVLIKNRRVSAVHRLILRIIISITKY